MEFEISGQTYQSGRLNARQQFHVARRLAPVLGGLADASAAGAESFSKFLQPIAEAISGMSDGDCDYVLDTCLSVVRRQQGPSWAPVMSSSKAMMFDDIDMSVMLQLASKVIQENLGNFFPGGSAGPLSQATATA
ncbi:hypothetical protein SAMN04487785_11321 [Dyella jiangningensis]|uniref:phage tail assembly chaperone n=1 Tax=Dyella sp. AtDHG13 TaxID=1938897 RepID=UPI00088CA352|nr:hypothetical protein [Dyella sp. AtDHG13]PXV60885.1 hypothetical protein BDW41_102616 [Dyella sp. AtDHG13]SDK94474.1 hypothetical protein SAMN04487785_11321 [Dyella jiangningensis]